MRINHFLCLLFGALSLTISAQEYRTPPNLPHYNQKKWHFGFTLGPELQDNRIVNNSKDVFDQMDDDTPKGVYQYYSEVPSFEPGFHVGIVTSLRLNNYLNLRIIPSLSLGEKNIHSQEYLNYKKSTVIEITQVKSTYVSCPVLIKYKALRIQDAGPYFVAGANIKYDLATDDADAITLKKMDVALEFGLGSDFYLAEFRLGIEVRFGIGLLNTLKTERPEDEYPYITASMDQIKAKTLTIAINFE